ncbi:hypothetical protein AAFC00_004528 [Neodothiora populina]|uniref:Glycoside hydrolase family 5 domain-containing protein n=1 Tax=Neodothiora populina TaxID=2781224 RepID=A0ABR3P340_9PEZI
MKKFFNKAKEALRDDDSRGGFAPSAGSHPPQQPLPSQDQPENIQPPHPLEMMRYRYQHGTNLGSVFVLERWMVGSMFVEGSNGSSELVAAEGAVKAEGMDGAKRKFERHWNEYCSDADLDWLVTDAKCNSIRLPIGYFTLGPAYCANTPFASVAPVYENAWAAVKNFTARCASRGIGVLLDMHALPGGANGGDHSGTNSGKAELWKSSKNLDLATRCILFVAHEARSMDAVIGIQIVNEAEWDAKGMYGWYDHVISQVGGIDYTMPIYISDAWNLGQCVGYCNGKNGLHAGKCANPVVIDTHLYWAFSDDDKKKTPQQITQEASGKLSELDGHDGSVIDHGGMGVVIGEYSCVLTEDSWGKAAAHEKEHLVKEFGQAQSHRYQSRAGGSFFWTYRMDWMDGGEWGFKQQTKNSAITPPHSLTLSHDDVRGRISHAQSQKDGKCGNTFGSHCQYWDGQHPGNYEHWRFEKGWHLGFNDAMTFFGARADGQLKGDGGDKIGFLDLWIRKRIVDSGQAPGGFLWEWEQGFRQGIRDFYDLAGI